MEEQQDTIVEEREELMVSPIGGNPTQRKARFLKPSLTSTDKTLFELPSLSLSSLPPIFDPKNWPLEVAFNGWRCPRLNCWKIWVDHMHSKHQSTWKKVGIYEAIMNCTYHILRDNDLVFGLAEKWCPETNTFIFSWGEATITLEDMIVLGGYSVLGSPVFTPLESRELKEIEEKMIEARKEIARTKAKKATPQLWTTKFMFSGIEFEHEAFLALWLSRYVFPNAKDSIRESVFSLAIHLARGTPIALAPAVLASIYRDLRLLKVNIVASTKLEGNVDDDDVLALTIWSPFHLVQIWAWERFIELRPKPNLIEFGETRLAQWHKMNFVEVENVRLALDSAGESFRWRPYATAMTNRQFPKFYKEKEMWVMVDTGLEEELESFVRCLRVSELVGLDCIEQYLPHRVAMQFGMDQDLPGCVARSNETRETAWKNYSKKISNVNLYIASRLFEADVTTRYLEWWKQSVLVQQQRRSFKRSKKSLQISKGKKRCKYSPVPPGCPPKPNRVGAEDSSKEDELTLTELKQQRRSFKRSKKSLQRSKGRKRCKYSPVPPGCPPKPNRVGTEDSSKEDKLTLTELLRASKKHDSVGNRQGGVDEPSSDQPQSISSSTVDDRAVRKTGSLMRREGIVMESEAAMGGSERAMEDPKETNAVSTVHNAVTVSIDGNGEGSSCTLEIPVVELEARISRLEKMVAELKAAKFAQKQFIKGGPSCP